MGCTLVCWGQHTTLAQLRQAACSALGWLPRLTHSNLPGHNPSQIKLGLLVLLVIQGHIDAAVQVVPDQGKVACRSVQKGAVSAAAVQ
jgi:hypothetical protein